MFILHRVEELGSLILFVMLSFHNSNVKNETTIYIYIYTYFRVQKAYSELIRLS